MNKSEELEKIKLEVKETDETLIQEILNNLDAIARVSDEIDKEIKNHDQNLETLLENLYKI